MKHQLLIEIKLDDRDEGYIKVLRCLDQTSQVIEEMKFSEGTITISKSKTHVDVEISDNGSSEAWVIENQWCLQKSAL